MVCMMSIIDGDIKRKELRDRVSVRRSGAGSRMYDTIDKRTERLGRLVRKRNDLGLGLGFR